MERIALYRKIKSPLYVQLELTDVCNLRCEHCYNFWKIDSDEPRSLNKEKADFLVAELAKNEVVQVVITGGEPLAKKEALFYLLQKLGEVGISFSLNTNLTLMTDETAKRLKSLGITSVLTSVLSFDEELHNRIVGKKDGFRKTVAGIKVAVENGIGVTANMVVNRYNKHQVYETGEFLHSIGAKGFTATKCSPPLGVKISSDIFDIAAEDIVGSMDDLLLLQEKFGTFVGVLECYPLCLFPNDSKYSVFTGRNCTAGVTACTIGADGFVRPCSHSDMTYGNVFTDGLQTCWDSMSDWRSGEYLPAKCTGCKYLQKCTGGCRMDAKFHGNISGMDPHANPANSNDLDALCQNTEAPVEIAGDQRLSVRKDVRLRKEETGYFTYVPKNKPMLITDDSAKLIGELSQADGFTVDEVSAAKSIDPKTLTAFVGKLIRLKVVKSQ